MNKSYKILVTGGCGSIGQQICKNLHEKGHAVTCFSRNPTCNSAIKGDITNYKLISENINLFDGVIHAAAAKNGKSSKEIIETNIIGTHNILECGKDLKFIKLISSSEAYSQINKVYGTSKLLAEELTKNYPNAFFIRIPTVLGSKQGFINKWIDDAKTKKEINLYLFNGIPKKKFFMTLSEAGIVCSILEKKQDINYRIIDAGLVAKAIKDLIGCKIIEIQQSGENYEMISETISSENKTAISYEETKLILRKNYAI